MKTEPTRVTTVLIEVDEMHITIHCYGDDPMHWSIGMDEDESIICLQRFRLIEKEVTRVINAMAAVIASINSNQE
jgi:hypothetical protein